MKEHWFSDSYSYDQHRKMAQHLKPLIVEFLGPLYELSHVGVFRDEFTGEVRLKLHLNPIGRIKCAGDPKLLTSEGAGHE